MRAAMFTATVVIAAVIAGCGGSAPPASTATPQPTPDTRLVVVGDSLAAGRYADTQADAFPQRVAVAMHAQLELVGVPGATTAQLASQPVPGGGKVVIVEAGTNDVLNHTPRGRFAADYRALLAKVRAASPGARLVCLTAWIPKGIAGLPSASLYDATIRRECKPGAAANLAPLAARPTLRGPAGRPTFLGPGDAFHPNSAGHAAIARMIEAR